LCGRTRRINEIDMEKSQRLLPADRLLKGKERRGKYTRKQAQDQFLPHPTSQSGGQSYPELLLPQLDKQGF
jgi:hypothetical protein